MLETNPRRDGSWDVVTRDGTIIAEHVVNCGGLWAREVGALAGVYLPLHPMEHQYLVTADAPEVYERNTELPHVMDPEGESYLRQEGRGLVIGFYEQKCDPWAVDGTPLDFGHELLPDKLDRIGDSLEFAFKRFPVLAKAGIKKVINGPFTFAPDGNPLVGPVPGLTNYWTAVAVMAGFSQGGGVGLTLAEWMVEGEPSRNVFAMDVARFGKWITPGYTRAKVRENYQRRFSIGYPNEELPGARPFRTTPAYSLWKAQRAVFGAGFGMEHVNYFAKPGEPLYETPSFRRSNAFATVAEECRAVREARRHQRDPQFREVSGRRARVPKPFSTASWPGASRRSGACRLSPMLSPKGRIIGDFTITRLAEDRFQLTASFGAQDYHMRWFLKHLPKDGVETHQCLDQPHRLPDRRAQVARSAGPRRQGRCVDGRLALHGGTRNGCRPVPRAGAARLLYRRSGLRDLCSGRGPAFALRNADGGRRRIRPQALRHARHDEPAARESPSAHGCANSNPTIRRSRPASIASSPITSRPTSSARRRR